MPVERSLTQQRTQSLSASSSLPQPYRRGYVNPAKLRADIAAAHATDVVRTTVIALADNASIAAAVIGVGHVARVVPWPLGVLSALLGSLFVARQLRALECLVHEGSHYNWHRRDRRVNDVMATLLAAVPTGALLSAYREGHLRHHGRFGTSADPDRRRYEELALEAIPRENGRQFVTAIVRRLPRYQLGWFTEVGASPARFLMSLAWGLAITFLPAALIDGRLAASISITIWLFAWVIVLPVVRLVAESDEHTYSTETTVFDATVSNLGRVQRLLFHPHGDGYHTLHHMWPGVPHHRLRRLHRLLLSGDPDYARRVRMRRRLLSRPTAAVTFGTDTAPRKVPA